MAKSSLYEIQHQLMNYLIQNDNAIEQKIITQGNVDNKTRLNIYKNAYSSRLREVIDTDHEILGTYLGDELFEQMVTGYIKANPSNKTSLRQYADKLPQYLHQTTPFDDHPILSELAHFERMLLTSFDAQEADRFSRQSLQAVPHENWPSMSFRLHPSVQVCKFHWNTVESWQALKANKNPDPAHKRQSYWLLWRNSERLTEFRSLDIAEQHLINMLVHGNDFSALCDYLLNENTDEDASTLALNYILNWVEQGILRQ